MLRAVSPGRGQPMNTGFRVALLTLLAVIAPGASASDAADAALAADGDFAAMSAESGQRAAFEEHLADDAIVFRPGAVAAREWFATHEEGTGRLDWTPSAAASDCSGEWAVTTGPWIYTNPDGDETAAGHYLSIWRRDPDGDWRVVLDNGVDHDPKARPEQSLQTVLAGLWPAGPAGDCRVAGAAARLQQAEHDLNQAIGAEGLAAALSRAANPGALAFRDDAVPGTIAAAAQADAAYGRGSAARSQFVSPEPDSDFGYSYGVIDAQAGGSPQSTAHASYVRVWHRDGGQWRVAVDMMTPLPPDGGQ
jgi:ketosteroid isomerase-like protein